MDSPKGRPSFLFPFRLRAEPQMDECLISRHSQHTRRDNCDVVSPFFIAKFFSPDSPGLFPPPYAPMRGERCLFLTEAVLKFLFHHLSDK